MSFIMNIPKHIAVIMDGNRRWAKERGLTTLEGHKKVADEILEPLIEHAATLGVSYMTFWAWSTENWRRDIGEVRGIMQLFRRVIQKKWQRLHEKGVRIRVIGNIEKFPADIKNSLEKVIEQTKNNNKITAVFALNYGGRDEVIRAINKWYRSAENNESIKIDQFNKYLDTTGIPDPELIIRPGGEQRLSGFLLWQSEYSELMFPDWYMPEFTTKRLDTVISEYVKRQRRFGR
jgi:undecaprenyl diphosphate synthase